MYFLLTLGYPKRDHTKWDEWNRYAQGALQVIHWETGELVQEHRYSTPVEKIAPDRSMQFKSGTLHGNDFFVPTNTEVLVYQLPELEIKQIYSHPTFNDLHHVTLQGDLIYICNTGLEMIQAMDGQGNIRQEYNVGVSPTWTRFKREMDYRLVSTTKPHETHANHLFFLDGQYWCTRFVQKDAICLDDPTKRIDLKISQGSPHDGLVAGDFIYFTITDGYIVVVHKETLLPEAVLDLNAISQHKTLLGWCRGIEVVGQKAYVGFTTFRKSKFKEYGLWIKHGKKPLGSRIAQYDLNTKTLEKEVSIARDTGASIFTVKNVSHIYP